MHMRGMLSIEYLLFVCFSGMTSITARIKCADVEQQISVLPVILMLAVLLSNVKRFR